MNFFEPLTDEQVIELSFAREPYGPSSKGICQVTTGGVCGSGSLVGKRNGKSLVLTNAHVAGTRIGKAVNCTFPHLGNLRAGARIIMAAYSDRVMMDWAVLEVDRLIDLPHVKLSNEAPSGKHYTGGYPRCRGPFYQELETTRITHGGTVMRWHPNSVGGQSGSGVHSMADNLQKALLTWSWGGDGAGQTTRSIWFQYANRGAGMFGFVRPEGLEELAENRADDLEEGFFAETNITTLPIWHGIGDDDDAPADPPADGGKIGQQLMQEAEAMQKQAARLAELARRAGGASCDPGGSPDNPPTDEDGNNTGPLFGL